MEFNDWGQWVLWQWSNQLPGLNCHDLPDTALCAGQCAPHAWTNFGVKFAANGCALSACQGCLVSMGVWTSPQCPAICTPRPCEPPAACLCVATSVNYKREDL
eukprot:scaffold306973_cov15-Tisochrysis_lutea.AAC.1